MPPEVKRRIDESVGMAKYVAEGGLGVARDVAGEWHRRRARARGSALAQFLAMRANGTDTEPPTRASPTPAPSGGTRAERTRTPTARRRPDDVVASDVAVGRRRCPIPDYDELSASQVVERLEGLDRESLDAIRAYETEHRGRNTILGKIAQLS